ncbi:transglutaminase family protein [Paenibacillus sp. V4I5]|uniref:transglutaminase-like domain-containing protein n=1 Tax=Paenibacillus sp. V4I5 TaxID=3042306 RepID=UPI00278F66E0|nr:transglutaminase-like domain-containing protein [Paenibacillus sp. V4I5]MDQ0918680.1 transglutaminase-like putative cysteine protease [Paenibacillus sp. V4I5]
MFKKPIIRTIIAGFLFTLAPQGIFAASNPSMIDKDALNKGIISVHYSNDKNKKTKVLVRIMRENIKYDYTFEEGGQYPLQLGNGQYKVLIGESIGANKYKVVTQEQIELEMEDENAVFLQSIPLIDWDNESKAVVEARQLVGDKEKDIDKIRAIYGYITTHFQYDYEKPQTVADSYVPNLDMVYAASNGICYDFAATFAAMARSEGIPTRLVMGYESHAPDTYHAWNQVFLKESKEWVTIDTTYDAVHIQAGETIDLIKNDSNYQISRIY